MWVTWLALALAWQTIAPGAASDAGEGGATSTRSPPRTLDRQAAELAWRAWLQSAESRDPGAPPRRITTKSLFITPFNCAKGQRLDRNGCITEVLVTQEEQERLLLNDLNALFTASPGEEYDYGDADPGPLQLSIPLALEAAPLQGQEPQPNLVKVDKKEDTKSDSIDASIEAELELLKLQSTQLVNDTVLPAKDSAVHSVLNNYLSPDKPKRDNSNVNGSVADVAQNITDEGQKEVVYGHVGVDPVLSEADYKNQDSKKVPVDPPQTDSDYTTTDPPNIMTVEETSMEHNETDSESYTTDKSTPIDDGTKNETLTESKYKPENEYSDIGEAIKLISRYAEVTTDDSFTKDQKKYAYDNREETYLGTRTKLQHRRNRPRPFEPFERYDAPPPPHAYDVRVPARTAYPQHGFYRYPWASQAGTPPPNYPFKHLQDYWAGRSRVQGLYEGHENPRRHHHSYPHSFRPHGYAAPFGARPAPPAPYAAAPGARRAVQRRAGAAQDRDLYGLLGLQHWFNGESAAKR